MIKKVDCRNNKRWIAPLSTEMVWMQCGHCQHIFREGYYYTPKALEILFQGTNSEQQVGYNLEEQRLVSTRIIDKIIPFKNNGIWLDVGFSNGNLLFTVYEYGFVLIGIDLRENNVETLKKLGIQAYKANLLNIESDTPISVISMADVLEHMPFPKEALQKSYKLLEKSGVLFLSLPNLETIVWQQYDNHNVNCYWSEMEHYHNFSRSRLYELLKEYGLTPIRYDISERYEMGMEIIAIKK